MSSGQEDEVHMFRGLLTVSVAFLICTAVGAVFGIFVGALAKDFLLWTALMAMVGAGFGIAMGYGFLPEK